MHSTYYILYICGETFFQAHMTNKIRFTHISFRVRVFCVPVRAGGWIYMRATQNDVNIIVRVGGLCCADECVCVNTVIISAYPNIHTSSIFPNIIIIIVGKIALQHTIYVAKTITNTMKTPWFVKKKEEEECQYWASCGPERRRRRRTLVELCGVLVRSANTRTLCTLRSHTQKTCGVSAVWFGGGWRE